jgi:hypothetical protein
MARESTGGEGVLPAFSQGALHDFRHRMIRADLERALQERTVDLARRTDGFSVTQLVRWLRVWRRTNAVRDVERSRIRGNGEHYTP